MEERREVSQQERIIENTQQKGVEECCTKKEGGGMRRQAIKHGNIAEFRGTIVEGYVEHRHDLSDQHD